MSLTALRGMPGPSGMLITYQYVCIRPIQPFMSAHHPAGVHIHTLKAGHMCVMNEH